MLHAVNPQATIFTRDNNMADRILAPLKRWSTFNSDLTPAASDIRFRCVSILINDTVIAFAKRLDF